MKFGNFYNYTHKNSTISTISFVDNSCQFYADKAPCLHLVRVALIEKTDIPGMNIQNTFSIHIRRKLKTKVAAFEIDEDEFCINDDDTESDNNDLYFLKKYACQ